MSSIFEAETTSTATCDVSEMGDITQVNTGDGDVVHLISQPMEASDIVQIASELRSLMRPELKSLIQEFSPTIKEVVKELQRIKQINCRYVYNTTSRRLKNFISFCMFFLHFLHLLSTLFSIYIYSSYSDPSCRAVIPYSLSIFTSDFPAWPTRLLLIYLQLLLGNI